MPFIYIVLNHDIENIKALRNLLLSYFGAMKTFNWIKKVQNVRPFLVKNKTSSKVIL
jgi:hypothetical protein